ncbi:hypothetical protein [Mucilaginibacter paludis]|uniref:Secreted protein n=1 Tax=Mucilaginibacter paludis DSM 18603 TaxID=714943 RepID=H1Y386_9SPHI|nr:hypothetical protein [Mucilaginibacter paludis]EHQ29241.1 hypothetical protein Mucpa_5166 [Mucilaginibacter paludis DSM 18603]
MKFMVLSLLLLSAFNALEAQVILKDNHRGYHGTSKNIINLLNKFKNSCLDSSIRYNYSNVSFTPKKTIQFLNKNFSTHIFSSCSFLQTSSSGITSDEKNETIILGIIEIGFNSTDKLNSALRTIKNSHREAFMSEVFTPFVLLKENSSLILIHSETRYKPIDCFFEYLRGLKGEYVKIN